MNKLYISGNSTVMLNELNQIVPINACPEKISKIFKLSKDTEVIYNIGEQKGTLNGKAGDIIIQFYGDFPKRVIAVDNKDWMDNINSYEEEEQRAKELWASKKDIEDENIQ